DLLLAHAAGLPGPGAPFPGAAGSVGSAPETPRPVAGAGGGADVPAAGGRGRGGFVGHGPADARGYGTGPHRLAEHAPDHPRRRRLVLAAAAADFHHDAEYVDHGAHVY